MRLKQEMTTKYLCLQALQSRVEENNVTSAYNKNMDYRGLWRGREPVLNSMEYMYGQPTTQIKTPSTPPATKSKILCSENSLSHFCHLITGNFHGLQ